MQYGGLRKSKLHRVERNSYLDHANYYIKKHNLLFLNIPKVASSTLWSIAAQLEDGFDTTKRSQVRDYKLAAIQSSQLHKYPDVRKVAFVRNPFDRIVSTYKNKVGSNKESFLARNKLDKGISFEDFIDFVCRVEDHNADRHIRSQYTFLYDYQGRLLVDYLGRLETFEADIRQVERTFQLPKLVVPHWNKTAAVDYQQYFTDAQRRQLENRYALDLQLLGYSFEQGLDKPLELNQLRELSDASKLEIMNYKTKKLLRVVQYKEKYDALPKGIKGAILRRYHKYFTDYFDMDKNETNG